MVLLRNVGCLPTLASRAGRERVPRDETGPGPWAEEGVLIYNLRYARISHFCMEFLGQFKSNTEAPFKMVTEPWLA